MTRSIAEQGMLHQYGYIDRRNQSTLRGEDRLRSLPGRSDVEESCPGCASTTCGCTRTRTIKLGRAETLSQARTWDAVNRHYLGDGFCPTCAAQAAYGHQFGFARVEPVCGDCAGKTPAYRSAAEQAHQWAGTTRQPPRQHQIAGERL